MRRGHFKAIFFIGAALFVVVAAERALSPNAPVTGKAPLYQAFGYGQVEGETRDFDALDAYWNDRLTYPTGHYNPAWLRTAAAQDARISAGCPWTRTAARAPSRAAAPGPPWARSPNG